jgi:hypothetical protein
MSTRSYSQKKLPIRVSSKKIAFQEEPKVEKPENAEEKEE